MVDSLHEALAKKNERRRSKVFKHSADSIIMNKTKISITVGTGMRKSGEAIRMSDLDFMYASAKSYLLDQCGAYSLYTIQGSWRQEVGSIVRDWVEPGVVFSVTVERIIVAPQRIAEHLRDIFDQQCVALETSTVNFDLI